MIITSIILLVSLLAILGMLYFRWTKIKSGKLEYVDRSDEQIKLIPTDWFKREKLGEMREIAHTVIIATIKFTVIITHIAEREIRKRFPRISRAIGSTTKIKEYHPIRQFLKHLGEYRRKMKKFKQKLQEHDRIDEN